MRASPPSSNDRLNVAHLALVIVLTGCALTGCVGPSAAPAPLAATSLTPEMPDCAFVTPVAHSERLLPEFTPDCPCALESASVKIDDCLVHAAPNLVYPCSRSEHVVELVLGTAEGRRLIQRDHSASAGCWQGTSTDTRSLRLCAMADGASRVVAERVRGDPVAAPDAARWAYAVAGPELDGLAIHLFVVDLGSGETRELDTQPFPQASVVGAQILSWSADAEWIDVSLWDGSAEGHFAYRLRTDGSGTFEALP